MENSLKQQIIHALGQGSENDLTESTKIPDVIVSPLLDNRTISDVTNNILKTLSIKAKLEGEIAKHINKLPEKSQKIIEFEARIQPPLEYYLDKQIGPFRDTAKGILNLLNDNSDFPALKDVVVKSTAIKGKTYKPIEILMLYKRLHNEGEDLKKHLHSVAGLEYEPSYISLASILNPSNSPQTSDFNFSSLQNLRLSGSSSTELFESYATIDNEIKRITGLRAAEFSDFTLINTDYVTIRLPASNLTQDEIKTLLAREIFEESLQIEDELSKSDTNYFAKEVFLKSIIQQGKRIKDAVVNEALLKEDERFLVFKVEFCSRLDSTWQQACQLAGIDKDENPLDFFKATEVITLTEFNDQFARVNYLRNIPIYQRTYNGEKTQYFSYEAYQSVIKSFSQFKEELKQSGNVSNEHLELFFTDRFEAFIAKLGNLFGQLVINISDELTITPFSFQDIAFKFDTEKDIRESKDYSFASILHLCSRVFTEYSEFASENSIKIIHPLLITSDYVLSVFIEKCCPKIVQKQFKERRKIILEKSYEVPSGKDRSWYENTFRNMCLSRFGGIPKERPHSSDSFWYEKFVIFDSDFIAITPLELLEHVGLNDEEIFSQAFANSPTEIDEPRATRKDKKIIIENSSAFFKIAYYEATSEYNTRLHCEEFRKLFSGSQGSCFSQAVYASPKSVPDYYDDWAYEKEFKVLLNAANLITQCLTPEERKLITTETLLDTQIVFKYKDSEKIFDNFACFLDFISQISILHSRLSHNFRNDKFWSSGYLHKDEGLGHAAHGLFLIKDHVNFPVEQFDDQECKARILNCSILEKLISNESLKLSVHDNESFILATQALDEILRQIYGNNLRSLSFDSLPSDIRIRCKLKAKNGVLTVETQISTLINQILAFGIGNDYARTENSSYLKCILPSTKSDSNPFISTEHKLRFVINLGKAFTSDELTSYHYLEREQDTSFLLLKYQATSSEDAENVSEQENFRNWGNAQLLPLFKLFNQIFDIHGGTLSISDFNGVKFSSTNGEVVIHSIFDLCRRFAELRNSLISLENLQFGESEFLTQFTPQDAFDVMFESIASKRKFKHQINSNFIRFDVEAPFLNTILTHRDKTKDDSTHNGFSNDLKNSIQRGCFAYFGEIPKSLPPKNSSFWGMIAGSWVSQSTCTMLELYEFYSYLNSDQNKVQIWESIKNDDPSKLLERSTHNLQKIDECSCSIWEFAVPPDQRVILKANKIQIGALNRYTQIDNHQTNNDLFHLETQMMRAGMIDSKKYAKLVQKKLEKIVISPLVNAIQAVYEHTRDDQIFSFESNSRLVISEVLYPYVDNKNNASYAAFNMFQLFRDLRAAAAEIQDFCESKYDKPKKFPSLDEKRHLVQFLRTFRGEKCVLPHVDLEIFSLYPRTTFDSVSNNDLLRIYREAILQVEGIVGDSTRLCSQINLKKGVLYGSNVSFSMNDIFNLIQIEGASSNLSFEDKAKRILAKCKNIKSKSFSVNTKEKDFINPLVRYLRGSEGLLFSVLVKLGWETDTKLSFHRFKRDLLYVSSSSDETQHKDENPVRVYARALEGAVATNKHIDLTELGYDAHEELLGDLCKYHYDGDTEKIVSELLIAQDYIQDDDIRKKVSGLLDVVTKRLIDRFQEERNLVLPKSLKAIPFPHQISATTDFIYNDKRVDGSEMGLGKSFNAAIWCEIKGFKRVLIISRAATRIAAMEELFKNVDLKEEEVFVLTPDYLSTPIHELEVLLKDVKYLIVSNESLRSCMLNHLEIYSLIAKWPGKDGGCWVDEGQLFDHADSLRTIAVWGIETKNRLVSTGTLFQNDPELFANVLYFCYPDKYPDLKSLQHLCKDPVTLKTLIRKHVHLSFVSDVAKEFIPFNVISAEEQLNEGVPHIPKLIEEEPIYIEMSESRARAYLSAAFYFDRFLLDHKGSELLFSKRDNFRQLSILRKILIDPQEYDLPPPIEYIMAIKDRAVAAMKEGKKVLIFCRHHSVINYLCENAEIARFGLVNLGGVAPDPRAIMRREFEENPNLLCAIAQFEAEGTSSQYRGIDLIINAELPSSISTDMQSARRALRLISPSEVRFAREEVRRVSIVQVLPQSIKDELGIQAKTLDEARCANLKEQREIFQYLTRKPGKDVSSASQYVDSVRSTAIEVSERERIWDQLTKPIQVRYGNEIKERYRQIQLGYLEQFKHLIDHRNTRVLVLPGPYALELDVFRKAGFPEHNLHCVEGGGLNERKVFAETIKDTRCYPYVERLGAIARHLPEFGVISYDTDGYITSEYLESFRRLKLRKGPVIVFKNSLAQREQEEAKALMFELTDDHDKRRELLDYALFSLLGTASKHPFGGEAGVEAMRTFSYVRFAARKFAEAFEGLMEKEIIARCSQSLFLGSPIIKDYRRFKYTSNSGQPFFSVFSTMDSWGDDLRESNAALALRNSIFNAVMAQKEGKMRKCNFMIFVTDDQNFHIFLGGRRVSVISKSELEVLFEAYQQLESRPAKHNLVDPFEGIEYTGVPEAHMRQG